VKVTTKEELKCIIAIRGSGIFYKLTDVVDDGGTVVQEIRYRYNTDTRDPVNPSPEMGKIQGGYFLY